MDFLLDLSLVRADHAERQRQAAAAHRAAAVASSPPARPWRWVGRHFPFTFAGSQPASSPVALAPAGSQRERE